MLIGRQTPNRLGYIASPKRLPVHAAAGDLGISDTCLRRALHARGLLTIVLPKTVEPINSHPTAEEMLDILTKAGLRCQRTPDQVQSACTAGSSRPVMDSHMASLRSRSAGQVRDQGLQVVVVQQGMTVLAHNGATLVRSRQQQPSKRAQKVRRLCGLRHRNVTQIEAPKD